MHCCAVEVLLRSTLTTFEDIAVPGELPCRTRRCCLSLSILAAPYLALLDAICPADGEHIIE